MRKMPSRGGLEVYSRIFVPRHIVETQAPLTAPEEGMHAKPITSIALLGTAVRQDFAVHTYLRRADREEAYVPAWRVMGGIWPFFGTPDGTPMAIKTKAVYAPEKTGLVNGLDDLQATQNVGRMVSLGLQ